MGLCNEELVLDKDNAEFNFAAEFVMQTSRLVYLTGKAGTGKTTFLKYIKEIANKRMVVLAPTGVAAVNAGGQTIHSFFNIKPSVYVPGDKRLRFNVPDNDEEKTSILDHFRFQREKLDLIRNLELLVIDEISMVRCDLLDVIDQLLRHIRRRHYIPFGGVQVLLIGDTFQLPPIANQDDWSVLSRFYKSPYFFSSMVFRSVKPVYIELKKIYRQKDENFIELLNRVRVNKLHFDDLRLLNSRFLHGFDPEDSEDYIILASHNRMVIETNQRRLDEIDEEPEIFEADVTGIFPENS
ncbi:MAG TPA: AAA family ATPase, partial [Lentimicrobium sp.]|nr:AAA family ATPase [Lentimicrobium sp.]